MIRISSYASIAIFLSVSAAFGQGVLLDEDYSAGAVAAYDLDNVRWDGLSSNFMYNQFTAELGNLFGYVRNELDPITGEGASFGALFSDTHNPPGTTPLSYSLTGKPTAGSWAGYWSQGGAYVLDSPTSASNAVYVSFTAGFEGLHSRSGTVSETNNVQVMLTSDGVAGLQFTNSGVTGSGTRFRIRGREGTFDFDDGNVRDINPFVFGGNSTAGELQRLDLVIKSTSTPGTFAVDYSVDGGTTWARNVQTDIVEADGTPVTNFSYVHTQVSNRQIVDAFAGFSGLQVVEVLPGDATLDRRVDIDDAQIVLGNWLSTNATWAQGDFNGDGTVGLDDASLLLGNWLSEYQPEANEATITLDTENMRLVVEANQIALIKITTSDDVLVPGTYVPAVAWTAVQQPTAEVNIAGEFTVSNTITGTATVDIAALTGFATLEYQILGQDPVPVTILIPEPATMALLGLGGLGVLLRRRRK